MLSRLLATALAIILASSVALAACTGSDIRLVFPDEKLAEIEASIAGIPYGEGIAFEASRGEDTVTLLGTAHLSALNIPTFVVERLPEADALVLELTSDEQARMQTEIQQSGMMFLPEGATGLDMQLGPERWMEMNQVMASMGIPSMVGTRMQPWMATILLALPTCEARAQQERPALDARVALLAQEADVPILGLETFEEALNAFTRNTPEEQLALLEEALETRELATHIIVTTEALWAEEKPQLLLALSEQLTEGESGLTDELTEGLLAERNRNWMPRLLGMLETRDDLFVAVGAGHLGGEDGLLVLLEAEGFAITRLDPNAP